VQRIVAKPCTRDGRVLFWRHLGAYLKLQFLANKFYLKIDPTWVITSEGQQVQAGPAVGRRVIKWTGPERNVHILYHLRFWTWILRRGRGPLSVWAGDQHIEISAVPALIQQAYGIPSDYRDLLGFLDDAAPEIAEEEDELADIAMETATVEETTAFQEDAPTENVLDEANELDDERVQDESD
jgi:hypothetical protein